MNLLKHIFFFLNIVLLASCVSTLNANKPGSTTEYSEDLTSYLPDNPIGSVALVPEENEAYTIDTTLIITARLDSVLLLVNNYNDEKTRYIKGLTIQLYSGNVRSKAKEVQMRAYKYFSDSKPRIIFDQPNYKVRMDEFYSQLEAYPVFKKVQSKFPKAILVPTRIPISKK